MPKFALLFIAIILLIIPFLRSKTQFHPISGKLYLPGSLSLISRTPDVLGWESEEVKPTDIIEFANKKRAEAKVPILHPDPKLMKAAQMRAEVMFRTEHVDHQDPVEGLNLASVLPQVRYLYIYASENIALAQGNAEGIINGFMNSPNHKINLLDKNLIETGVGVVKGNVGGNHVVIVAHLFGVPQNLSAYQGSSSTNPQVILETTTETTQRLNVETDSSKQKLLKRQLEILDHLANLTDISKPYTESDFMLLDEFHSNSKQIEL